MNQSLEVIFDWIEFTIKDIKHEDIILQVLEMEIANFTSLERGRYGYRQCLIYGNILVLYDGREDMGVHVILTGQGCREYENKDTLLNLLKRINDKKGKLTRIDIAIDDKIGKIIPFNKIIEDIKQGNVVSRWKSSLKLLKRDLSTGKVIGETLNLGARSSEIYMRIYNKGLEQKEKDPTLQHWVRMELEIKKKKAEKLHKILLEINNIGVIVAKVILNYIRFLTPSKDKNKSRWEIRPYWQNILKETEKLSLSSKAETRTVEDVRNWIEKQIAPSLAVLLLDNGGDVGDIMAIIKNGRNRLKPKHYQMLQLQGGNDDVEQNNINRSDS